MNGRSSLCFSGCAQPGAGFASVPVLTRCPLSSPSRWAFLELRTNGRYNDSLQAYAAGVVEAAVSEEVRPDWGGTRGSCLPSHPACPPGSFEGL